MAADFMKAHTLKLNMKFQVVVLSYYQAVSPHCINSN